jgi:DNA polymerase-3 subunit beta
MASAADDYPALPDVEYDKAITIPQNVLKDMISGTIFSVSENQARPIQTGCKFEIDPECITVVAVDGYRLALRREKIDNPENRKISFVVPAPALREVEKILGDTDEDASFTLGTRHILFKVGSATLVCRLLEGEFLDWRRVVPTDNPIRLSVNVKELTQSIDRVSLIVSEKLKSPVRCTFGENVAAFRTSNSIGNVYDECQIAGNGNDLEIGFNCRYLLDALKAVPAENIMLELKTNLSPAVINPCEGDKFTYMVLPVRLKAE